jgi:protein-S-isoprenylcysteine O-methyltransferase Ste14
MIGFWLLILFVPLVAMRVAVARKKSGDSGFRFSPELMRGWEGVSVGIGVTAWLTAVGFAVTAESTGATLWSGLVVYLAAVAVVTWAQFAMGDSWRIGVDRGERTSLVVRGPFRAVRNPIYTGMTGALVGIALVTNPPWSFIAPALSVLSVEIQARLVEEPHLRSLHPDYTAYAGRVGRFLPGVGH